MDSRSDVADLVQRLGAAEVGRRYVARLVMTASSAGGSDRDRVGDEPLDDRTFQAIWLGEDDRGRPLPNELRWEVTVAALHACPDDDELLWCLGDGPFDHMLDVAELRQRLGDARNDPLIGRLFSAMQRCLPSEGVTGGWWFEAD